MLVTFPTSEKNTLPPIGIAVALSVQKIILGFKSVFIPEVVIEKPESIRCSERAWLRHSAFIMSQRDVIIGKSDE